MKEIFSAIADARAGRLGSARRAWRLAVDLAPADAVVRALAGILAFVTRDYGESLEHFWEAARLEPRGSARLHQMASARAGSLGWDRDQLRAIEAWIAVSPGDARAHASAARLHLGRRNWQTAIAHLEAQLLRTPEAAELHLERARALLELGSADAATEAVTRAREKDARYVVQMQSGHLLRAAGRFDDAARCFEQARAGAHEQAAPATALAELAMWRGDHARALDELQAALSLEPGSARALRAAGALLARGATGGDAASAEDLFRRALAADPDEAEAHAWLGEMAIARKNWAAAKLELDRAVARTGGDSFPVLLLWALAVTAEAAAASPSARLAFANFQEIAQCAETIEPGASAIFEAGDATACRELLESLLRRLGCNRSACATYEAEGGIRVVPRVPGVRFRSRHALSLFRLVGLPRVRELLLREAAAHPSLSLPLCHLGEAELWAGELDAARATLERTIAIWPATRWAWIGLTAVAALGGDPERALAVSARGVEEMWGTIGPALYVHRGDAYRLAGRLTEARADLEHAVDLHPRRVSARICLALVLAGLGETEGVAAGFQRIAEDAPGLVSDAAREAGVAVWTDPDEPHTHTERVRVLERALAMMRGNRSASTITYFTASGELRGCDFGGGPAALHARDAAALDQAAKIATGVRRIPTPRTSR